MRPLPSLLLPSLSWPAARPRARFCLLQRSRAAGLVAAVALVLAGSGPAHAQRPPESPGPAGGAPTVSSTPGDEAVLQAQAAFRKRDKAALAALRSQVAARGHALAAWVDYWELFLRLPEVQQPELEAFYARWPGSYVEDRLRNDWLLELGRRRDWANFRTEHPRFRMADDREVACYALLAQHAQGAAPRDLRDQARAAWLAQREADDGCLLLGRTLLDSKTLTADDGWRVARQAAEMGRTRTARAVIGVLVNGHGPWITDALDNPARFLTRAQRPGTALPLQLLRELAQIALIRLAAQDPETAAAQLDSTWASRLAPPEVAHSWAQIARSAAMKQHPQALAWARQAWSQWELASQKLSVRLPGRAAAAVTATPPWSDELLAWQVRAALRSRDEGRWALAQRAIDSLSATEQRDPAWAYWRARAQTALAPTGPAGDEARAAAQQALGAVATSGGGLGFYALLAQEDLGLRPSLPVAAAPLSASEREAARQLPGLQRALALVALGLRSEGVREWNFTLRGMSDRELIAAAQWACDRQVWDRCINTSERSRTEVDLAQRYPTPFREALQATAQKVGLDPAVMLGLIRQESRFQIDARSSVGASGLMQLMPATAQWMAKKLNVDFKPGQVNDAEMNLLLGASYLKRLLDDFDGSLALAAAGYNAGPGRPRRWREGGPVMEPAAWAETIPFNETRDYVKKVTTNAALYGALLNPGAPVSLKARLGAAIGPARPEAKADTGNAPERDTP